MNILKKLVSIPIIPLTPWTLFTAQLIAHLSFIPMFLYASIAEWAIAIAIYFIAGTLGITMTYHRLLSHRSWKCPAILEKFFVLLATITMSGSAIVWVSVHRMHHKHTDTEKDPHSPLYKGFIKTQWGSMFIDITKRNIVDLLRQPFYTFQHHHYFTIILSYVLLLYIIDPFAIVYAFLVPAAIVWNMGSAIFTASHRNGAPHNDIVLALTSWGEGYHYNHHNNPLNKRFGKYDIGGIVIKGIENATS